MAEVGKYCKAYAVGDLRQFAEWSEHTDRVRPDIQLVDGQPVVTPRQLQDGDYVFLQESYVVTDGIFKDEHVIFDAVTPAWKAFCESALAFAPPADEPAGESEES
jgi:hypothetical protein